jgi:hypothetical protein
LVLRLRAGFIGKLAFPADFDWAADNFCISDVSRQRVERPDWLKQGLSTSKLDRRVPDQKAAIELANIIRQLWVGSGCSLK